MVWTCRAQHRLDCRSTQAECGCTEKIWQAKEIMGWSAWEWQKEARYGFCWPSEPFWVERTPSRKTCQKAQPSVEENRAVKWIWWWWCFLYPDIWHKIGPNDTLSPPRWVKTFPGTCRVHGNSGLVCKKNISFSGVCISSTSTIKDNVFGSWLSVTGRFCFWCRINRSCLRHISHWSFVYWKPKLTYYCLIYV